MRNIRLTIVVAILALLGACTQIDDYGFENNDSQNYKITIKATVEDNNVSTRAGIVEGNEDYSSGETFYWNEGDKIRVYFVNAESVSSSLFEVETVYGNSADFIGTIPSALNGIYTIYASKDLEQTSPTSTELKLDFPQQHTQTGSSSQGVLLPLISTPLEGILIENGELSNDTALNFSLKQLNSLLRFTFENNSDQDLTIESIVISVKDDEGESQEVFASEAIKELNSTSVWDEISSGSLYDQLTLSINQNENGATIAEGNKFDAYLSILPTDGFTVGDHFTMEVTFKGADGFTYLRKAEVEISNNGDFAFLSTGLEDAMRYYFQSELTVDNTFKVTVVTFEDEEGSDYWTSLIDDPQYGGPLLYLSADYEWMDYASGLYSGTYGKVYWSGGLAISNYYSEDFETYGDHLSQLTVYGTAGNNSSSNCAISFGYLDDSGFTSPEWQPKMHFDDGIAKTIDHMYIAPTTYFYNVAVNGNPLSPAVGDDDVWITATGYLDGIEGNTVTTYMIKEGVSIINSWTKWDLTGLGKVDEVIFNMGGGTDNNYGFSLPAYFAIDDIMIIHN